MLSRGYIIGRIIDDLAVLKQQIIFRNSAVLFDLTKVCEDFFKELLNYINDYHLKNLNKERHNSPGLDLGDDVNRIAFQVTSTVNSKKIKQTLEAITEDQIKRYDTIYILVTGKEQNSYTVADKGLLKKAKNAFDTKKNIIGLNDLIQEIAVLELDKLISLNDYFNKSFRTVKIELELIDKEGSFASSNYNRLEHISDRPPKNCNKLSKDFDKKFNFQTITEIYHKLSRIPRLSREYLSIIAERGESKEYNMMEVQFGINTNKLSRLLNISEQELNKDLFFLEDEGLIYIGEKINDYDSPIHSYVINDVALNRIFFWAEENGISLKTLLNTMNFTVLDE